MAIHFTIHAWRIPWTCLVGYNSLLDMTEATKQACVHARAHTHTHTHTLVLDHWILCYVYNGLFNHHNSLLKTSSYSHFPDVEN